MRMIKAWLLAALIGFTPIAPAQQPDSVVKLLDAVTVTGAQASYATSSSKRSFQAIGQTTSGSGSAVVQVQVSNDRVNWVNDSCVFTLTLSTTPTTGGCVHDSPWRWVQGYVVSISGTGAAVTLYMGR